MSTVKRQHYVPQMLLSRFAASDGKIDVIERGSGRFWRSATSQIACEKYYNAIRTGHGDTDTQAIEKELSCIEGCAAPVLKKIINKHKLSSDERSKFSLFITTQDFRSPRKRQQFADLMLAIEHHGLSATPPQSIEEYADMIHKASNDDSVFDYTADPTDPRLSVESDGTITVAREDTTYGQRAASIFAPVVEDMDWIVFEAPEGKKFILSDSPVQLYENPDRLPENTGPAYWREHSKIVFPLSSEICLVCTHNTRKKGNIRYRQIWYRKATSKDWKFFNSLQVRGSYRQIYATVATRGLICHCKKAGQAKSELSFMPVSREGGKLAAKVKRGKIDGGDL